MTISGVKIDYLLAPILVYTPIVFSEMGVAFAGLYIVISLLHSSPWFFLVEVKNKTSGPFQHSPKARGD